MTLDEIEKDAAHVVKHWAGMPSHATAERLARALLLVMPVVRAAAEYRDEAAVSVGMNAESAHVNVWLARQKIRAAIDTMRRGLGKG